MDYQPTSALRGSFKYTGWGQQNPVFNGTIPGYNDSKMYKPDDHDLRGHVELHDDADHVSRGDVRSCAKRPDRVCPRAERHRAGVLHGWRRGGPAPGGFMMNPDLEPEHGGLRHPADLFDASTMFTVDPSYYAYKQLARSRRHSS